MWLYCGKKGHGAECGYVREKQTQHDRWAKTLHLWLSCQWNYYGAHSLTIFQHSSTPGQQETSWTKMILLVTLKSPQTTYDDGTMLDKTPLGNSNIQKCTISLQMLIGALHVEIISVMITRSPQNPIMLNNPYLVEDRSLPHQDIISLVMPFGLINAPLTILWLYILTIIWSHHYPDPSLPLVVGLYPSRIDIELVLSQCHSHPCQTCIGTWELLAMKIHLRNWLDGLEHPFLILTDHKKLEYIKSAKRLSFLNIYIFKFTYVKFTLTYRRVPKIKKSMHYPVYMTVLMYKIFLILFSPSHALLLPSTGISWRTSVELKRKMSSRKNACAV